MLGENRSVINILYIISFCSVGLGVIIGSVYYVYNFIGTADIKNYLDGYLNNLRNGMDLTLVAKSSVKSYTLLFIGIVMSSFFKYGFFLSFFLLIRKGFVSAFTLAAMVDVYGFKGILLSMSSLIPIVVLIPILCVLSSASLFSSKNHKQFERRDKIIYIIFYIVVFTIFCACALFESVLTTIFMKWLVFKVT